MHELSLAMELVELARREAAKHGASTVSEIQIAIGDLSGVEADAFQSALELAVKDTILEHASLDIIRIPGKGTCNNCNTEFLMKNPIDTCPHCRCFPSEISGGQEFKVMSMMVE